MPIKRTSSTVRSRSGAKLTSQTAAYKSVNGVYMSDFRAARGRMDSVRQQRVVCMATSASEFGIDAAQRGFNDAVQRELRLSILA